MTLLDGGRKKNWNGERRDGMDHSIRVSEIKIVLKEGPTILAYKGSLVLTDRYVFLQRDDTRGLYFQREIIPWETILHIGYDVE